jgi:hypothetical protein
LRSPVEFFRQRWHCRWREPEIRLTSDEKRKNLHLSVFFDVLTGPTNTADVAFATLFVVSAVSDGVFVVADRAFATANVASAVLFVVFATLDVAFAISVVPFATSDATSNIIPGHTHSLTTRAALLNSPLVFTGNNLTAITEFIWPKLNPTNTSIPGAIKKPTVTAQ